ncbi:MAG: type II toxin-antitoxin system ParD family antitoxin [Bacteroidales bacterium]|nr:type II toxin-antitoxin system ParD family antitoxin [Bacteroidales bacterium]
MDEIKTGRYNSASEVIRIALRYENLSCIRWNSSIIAITILMSSFDKENQKYNNANEKNTYQPHDVIGCGNVPDNRLTLITKADTYGSDIDSNTGNFELLAIAAIQIVFCFTNSLSIRHIK